MVTWNTATQHITMTDVVRVTLHVDGHLEHCNTTHHRDWCSQGHTACWWSPGTLQHNTSPWLTVVVRVTQHVDGHLEHCNTTHHHDWCSQGHTACQWSPETLQHNTPSTEVDTTSSTEPQNQCLIAVYLRWRWFPAGDVGGYHSGHRLGAAGWAARLLSTAAGIPLPAPYHATRGAAGKGSVPRQPDPSPWEHDREQPHWEQDRENIPKNRTKNKLTDNRMENNISENRTKNNLSKNRTENNTPEKRTKHIFTENRAENKLPTNL